MKNTLDWQMEQIGVLQATSKYFQNRQYIIVWEADVYFEASYDNHTMARSICRGSLYECLAFCENAEATSYASKLEKVK